MQLMIRLSIPDPSWNNTVTQGTGWDRCVNPRARFSGMDHAMETSGLQNSSHLQEWVIWPASLLTWEFTPMCGILQEKELFQGLLKVRNYYHFLPLQTRIVTRKQKQQCETGSQIKGGNRDIYDNVSHNTTWICPIWCTRKWLRERGWTEERAEILPQPKDSNERSHWWQALEKSLSSSKGRNKIRMTQMLYSHQKCLPSPTCTPAVTGHTKK